MSKSSARRKRGRPPAGVGGERSSEYPQLAVRVPQVTIDQCVAIAERLDVPQWLVAMDDEGLRIDALEELLAELDREGRRPMFIYSVPTFQNPGGVTLSLARRRRLVEIARERVILVV